MVSPSSPMSGVDLPWSIFGRRVKPLALAASVANMGIAIGLYDSDSYFSQVPHLLVLVTAVSAVVMFWAGWWLNNVRLVSVGLLLTVGVFTARAALASFTEGVAQPVFWLSVSWTVAAAGAFLLEKRAPRSWEPEAYGGRSE